MLRMNPVYKYYFIGFYMIDFVANSERNLSNVERKAIDRRRMTKSNVSDKFGLVHGNSDRFSLSPFLSETV